MFDKSKLSLVRLHTQLLSSTNVFLSNFIYMFYVFCNWCF